MRRVVLYLLCLFFLLLVLRKYPHVRSQVKAEIIIKHSIFLLLYMSLSIIAGNLFNQKNRYEDGI